MKFAVTGGAGFVGSNIAKKLVDDGEHQILIIDNLNSGKLENLESIKGKFDFFQVDIREYDKVEDILRDGITEDELLRSKTNLVNKLAMSYENTHTIAMYYNEMLMMEHSPIVTINDFIKGIKSMKIKKGNEVIRKYLSFEKMTICVVGNYTEKQIIEHLSKQF